MVLDVGLTSTIGFNFLILGLLDAGILNQKSKLTWGIWGAGTFGIFYGWVAAVEGKWKAGFFVLYMVVVAIGCGAWTIIQMVLVLGNKDWASLKWLVFAGFHGGFGMYSLMDARLQKWICENIDCHFATSFIWFFVTDTAIYFIYRFYVSRVDFEKKQQLRANNYYTESLAYTRIN